VIAVDYLGLPVGACVVGARRHEVGAAQDLLDGLLPRVPRVTTVLGDRGFRGLEGPLAAKHGVTFEVRHRDDRQPGEFAPIRPLWRVEDAFAELGRWRRLARSFEGSPASATAWPQVACVGRLLSFV
jgi:putative transposase